MGVSCRVKGKRNVSELQEKEQPQGDSPESLRIAGMVAGGWLLAMLMLPTGGLLWQWGMVQHMGSWLLSTVLAQSGLSGLFI